MADNDDDAEREADVEARVRKKRRREDDSGSASSADERDGDSSDESEDEEELAFTACAEGDLDLLKQMHEAGALDPNRADAEEDVSLLGVACRFGHLAVAQWLISIGASTEHTNEQGELVLDGSARCLLPAAGEPG